MGRKCNTIPREYGSRQKNIWFYRLLDNLKADFRMPLELSWTSRSETSPSRRWFMLKPPQGRGKVELLHQVKVVSRLLFSVRLIGTRQWTRVTISIFFFKIDSCFTLKNERWTLEYFYELCLSSTWGRLILKKLVRYAEFPERLLE